MAVDLKDIQRKINEFERNAKKCFQRKTKLNKRNGSKDKTVSATFFH